MYPNIFGDGPGYYLSISIDMESMEGEKLYSLDLSIIREVDSTFTVLQYNNSDKTNILFRFGNKEKTSTKIRRLFVEELSKAEVLT